MKLRSRISGPPSPPAIIGLLTALWLVGLYLAWVLFIRPHIAEGLETPSATSNQIYMLSAVIAGAGALLQAGVIALAPLLSLSLHQSYDALFELLDRLRADGVHNGSQPPAAAPNTPAGPQQDPEIVARKQLAEQCMRKLCFYELLYKLLNPLYLASWGSTCLLLVGAAILLTIGPWTQESVIRYAMQFFVLSVINAAAFGLLSLLFFVLIQPGVTKLDYYLQYFKIYYDGNMSKPTLTLSRRGFWAIVAIIVVAAALGSYIAIRIQRRPKVAVNALAIAAAPVLLAESTKALDAVELTRFDTGRAALDAVINGDAILATVAETPVVLGSVDHPNLRILQTIAESQLRLIVDPSVGIHTIADLKGKRVAIADGTSSEFFLRQTLLSAKLTLEEVKLFNLRPADMATALGRHEVDAVAIWEPHAQRAFKALPNAVDLSPKGLYVERFNIVTTAETLQSARTLGTIHDFLRTMVSTSQTMRTQPRDALKRAAELLHLPEADLAEVWPQFRFPGELDSPSLLETMNEVETWAAIKQNRTARKVEKLQLLIDPVPLSAALHPAAGR